MKDVNEESEDIDISFYDRSVVKKGVGTNLAKMFDKMENKAFKATDTGTELTKVSTDGATKQTTTCTPQVCRSARQRFQPPDLANNSPWHAKKTYFFLGTIALLVIWVIIYTVVSQLKLV